MEYVDGGSLSKRLETTGPFDPVEAARLIATTARAVHVAHQARVIHRDLKPSNILLTTDGVPKISDFGLAKRIDRDDGLTTASGPLGTPGYMAPEQVRGSANPIGPATDVYGLGATLYHLLTGRPPFRGLQPDILNEVLRDPPERPRASKPEIPRALEAIVLKCLEKKPEQRYPSAEALADDLDRFLNGTPQVAPELTWRRRVVQSLARHRRGLAWTGVAVLAAVLVFVIGAAFQPKDPLKRMRDDLAAGKPVTLIGERGNPAWHQWVLGAPEFVPSPTGDGTCSYEAIGFGFLDLCPDPIKEGYRLQAEIRYVNARGLPVAGTTWAGVYFGRSSHTGANGVRAHAFWSVDFKDAPRVAKPPAWAGFGPCLVSQQLDKNPYLAHSHIKSTSFIQAEQLPGPWRLIEIEVTPERVRVSWLGDDGKWVVFADMTTDAIRREYDKLNKPLTNPRFLQDHGIVIPEWSPRMPLGIWSYGTGVAVRNVILTPLD
jgi:serine/threonine-protein kinase